jgi:hypothetical protein
MEQVVLFATKVEKWRVGVGGLPESPVIETAKSFTTKVTKEHKGDRWIW